MMFQLSAIALSATVIVATRVNNRAGVSSKPVVRRLWRKWLFIAGVIIMFDYSLSAVDSFGVTSDTAIALLAAYSLAGASLAHWIDRASGAAHVFKLLLLLLPVHKITQAFAIDAQRAFDLEEDEVAQTILQSVDARAVSLTFERAKLHVAEDVSKQCGFDSKSILDVTDVGMKNVILMRHFRSLCRYENELARATNRIQQGGLPWDGTERRDTPTRRTRVQDCQIERRQKPFGRRSYDKPSTALALRAVAQMA